MCIKGTQRQVQRMYMYTCTDYSCLHVYLQVYNPLSSLVTPVRCREAPLPTTVESLSHQMWWAAGRAVTCTRYILYWRLSMVDHADIGQKFNKINMGSN